MNYHIDDPKLTAYVLGELPEEEAKSLEAWLKDNPEAQTVVDDIRGTIGLLEGELYKEPAYGLKPDQIFSINQTIGAGKKNKKRGFSSFFGSFRFPIAAAASVLLVAGLAVLMRPQFKRGGGDLARVDETGKKLANSNAMKEKDRPRLAAGSPPLDVQNRTIPSASSMPPMGEMESRGVVTPTYTDDAFGFSNTQSPAEFNTEGYDRLTDNSFFAVAGNPLSTFSIDVDTASYSNVRRFLTSGHLPPPDAVRIEEMVNYFTYDYPAPTDDKPFAAHTEIVNAPWAPEHRLLKIGIKGKDISNAARKPANLVFLIDVSGSMQEPDKLPLVKRSLKMLVENLKAGDRVAMVVYAGSSGLVLDSTPGLDQKKIFQAIERLEAGGSTNGGAGIVLAYQTAEKNFIKGGVNRVVLASDGDFNVGLTNQAELTSLIEEKAKSDVFLSVLSFGRGNIKDSTMEQLADKGNGNYAYIDSISEARKVLVEQMGGTLVTIAKDVKIQVEFNPALVSAYRLIGYENRMLRAEDFNNDKIDAGEIGAGHTVTALYEIVPVGVKMDLPAVDPLKYKAPEATSWTSPTGEIANVKLRYKDPTGNKSSLLEYPVKDGGEKIDTASADMKFASAVAAFGMILRDSPHKGSADINSVLKLAQDGVGGDSTGYRYEFVSLIHKAKGMKK